MQKMLFTSSSNNILLHGGRCDSWAVQCTHSPFEEKKVWNCWRKREENCLNVVVLLILTFPERVMFVLFRFWKSLAVFSFCCNRGSKQLVYLGHFFFIVGLFEPFLKWVVKCFPLPSSLSLRATAVWLRCSTREEREEEGLPESSPHTTFVFTFSSEYEKQIKNYPPLGRRRGKEPLLRQWRRRRRRPKINWLKGKGKQECVCPVYVVPCTKTKEPTRQARQDTERVPGRGRDASPPSCLTHFYSPF